MTSGAETAGAAAIKIFGLPAIAGAVAAALGFCVMWPKSAREAFARFTASIASSFIAGPYVLGYVRKEYPDLVTSVVEAAMKFGNPPEVGWLHAAGPCYVLAALPAWWVLGIGIRTLHKWRDRDAIEVAQDIKKIV